MRKITYLWALLFGATVFMLSGCQSFQSSEADPVVIEEVPEEIAMFDFEGMPNRTFLVGGGYMISYRASEEGDLYIADEASQKLLATITLQPGEKHELLFDINDENLATNMEAIGIDPKKASIKVYFVPR